MRTQRRAPRLAPTFLISALLAGALPGFSGAEEPRVSGVALAFVGRELRVEARLSPGLPEEVRQRCGSGLPTTAAWEVRLYGHREVWWDGLKDERVYEVTAAYRPVSSDWVVERRLDGKLLETRTVPTLDEAVAALSAVRELPVFIMGNHLIGKSLQLRVRCTYGDRLVLGVIPGRVATPWERSEIFGWAGEKP